MRKAFYIESIKMHQAVGYKYVAVPQNAKYLYKLWESCNLKCVRMDQQNDECWRIMLQGKRKDIEEFIRLFSIKVSTIYKLSEAIW